MSQGKAGMPKWILCVQNPWVAVTATNPSKADTHHYHSFDQVTHHPSVFVSFSESRVTG